MILREKCGLRKPGKWELYWNRWSMAFEFIFDHDAENGSPWMLHFHLLLLGVCIHFPCWLRPKSRREDYMRDWQRWGFSHCDDAIHFYWNERTVVWWLPWLHKVHQRHEVRRADGSWVPFVGSWEHDKEPDGREQFEFPYTYRLRSGEIQNRIATVFVERRAWRPKWFQWTALFEESHQNIDVTFNDEVGECTGSWKGGTVGCGYSILPGESPEQTLRRMERERIFV